MSLPYVDELRSFFLITFALVACWTDLTERKIPNVLCGTALVTGLSFFYIFHGGVAGLASSAIGVFFSGGVFLFFYALGGFGAGDVKLIGSLASFLGFPLCIRYILYVAVAGGILGVGILIRHGAFLWGLKRSVARFFGAKNLERSGDTGIEEETTPKKKPVPRSVPYGTAVLMGILAMYLEGSI